jgi:hypothetical protein
MIPLETHAVVQVMGGLVMFAIQRERATITLTQKQVSLELLILTLGFLTKKGFQQIWQISFDSTGRVTSVSLM